MRTIVAAAEKASAAASAQPHLAGSYHYLSSYEFPTGLFHGESTDWDLRYGDHVAVMGCNCGVVGCWQFLVKIVVTEEEVVWREFRQPHRPSWDYSELGEWRFDRREYDDAVAAAEREYANPSVYPDELRELHVERVRSAVSSLIRVLDVMLLATERANEIPRTTRAQRQRLLADPEARQREVGVYAARLGISDWEAGTLVARDIRS